MPQTPSTRWCPTPEQLMILEEMYCGGVRTPNASQIQQITAHLSLYGKIEGKNVFYWFQNHKARERQKLRRKLGRQQPPVPQSDQGSSAPSPPLLQNNQTPTNNLYQVGKLESSAGSEEEEEEKDATASDVDARYAQPWMAMMEGSCSAGPPRCMPPVKTLDLFPTSSTGALRDECSSSKSSSCSTSTN